MKTELELDLKEPGTIKKIIEPSLDSDRKVSYTLESNEALKITIETDSLGPLRGSTDTAFRLAMLANKLH